METNSITKLLNEFKKLSIQEREKFLSYISINSTPADEKHIIDTKFADGLVCPHCGASGKGVYKRGKAASGKQRFYCHHCNHSFSATTGSITYNSKLPFSVWKKYISCFMEGLSVRESAEQCQISVLTSWRLRHKICDSLNNIMNGISLSGIVEADETYFRVSYKGNKKAFKNGTAGRAKRKRGSSIFHKGRKRGLSNEQVCVPCAVNRNGLSVSKVSSIGKASYQGISTILSPHITRDSVLCTDGEVSYGRLAKEKGIYRVQVSPSSTFKSIYSIQHINNYHSRLKNFIGRFNGVSTKHLNNYLLWFNFSKFAKETNSEKVRILTHHLITANCYTKVRDISRRPMIPYVCEQVMKTA